MTSYSIESAALDRAMPSPPSAYRLKAAAKSSLPPARCRQVLQRELASRLGYAIERLESLRECAAGLERDRNFQASHLRDVERRCTGAIASFERLKQSRARTWEGLYRRTDAAIVDCLQAFARASRSLSEIAERHPA